MDLLWVFLLGALIAFGAFAFYKADQQTKADSARVRAAMRDRAAATVRGPAVDPRVLKGMAADVKTLVADVKELKVTFGLPADSNNPTTEKETNNV
jgi:hypothetical protein